MNVSNLTPPIQVGQRWYVSQPFTSLVTGIPFQQREEFEIVNITSVGQYTLARIKDCCTGLDCTISSDDIMQYCAYVRGPGTAAPGVTLPIGVNIPFSSFKGLVDNLDFYPGIEKQIMQTAEKKCECGVHSLGLDNHSDYCPLYKGE